ncbi:hypothetical protein JTE90_026661 [Oedothorax gibbosus]|uniref:ATP-dependent DNA helicase n=1 Tax=Oedothorax gibbosus TaxID=931172 RepID=A0AAV6TSX1_9ARAC|nr:hypothetical protein JTE90_026661 [Oedothorax gibbosus]
MNIFGGTSSEALCDIEAMLTSENRTCEDFGLAKPDIFTAPVNCIDIGSHSQKCYEIEEKLNDDQLGVYNRVHWKYFGECQQTAQCFFIEGPGGTGKTFLYTGIYHRLLAMIKKTACVAWTGIASILLPCGTTSNRFFNLPIQLNEEGICFTNPCDKWRLY